MFSPKVSKTPFLFKGFKTFIPVHRRCVIRGRVSLNFWHSTRGAPNFLKIPLDANYGTFLKITANLYNYSAYIQNMNIQSRTDDNFEYL